MHPFALIAALFLATPNPGTPAPAGPTDDPQWHDARTLTLEGKGWKDTAAPYDRLPARAKEQVRGPVWALAHDSAGMVVRFTSDAGRISVRWSLTSDNLAMPHMPAAGVSGVDLYVRTERGWRWLGASQPGARQNTTTFTMGLEAAPREYQLYLPLYNGVTSVEVGVPAGASLAPAPREAARARPLVFHGTSITQGGCASRPGAAHVAILGRHYDRPVINLGFSGNGKMELPLARLLGELEAEVFVIDCLPNMSPAEVAERTVPFVTALRAARPKTPILLVEDRTFSHAAFRPDLQAAHAARRKALADGYAELRRNGIEGLFYLEGGALLGDDGEGTVDGSHPTDLGFLRQARLFQGALDGIVGERGRSPSPGK